MKKITWTILTVFVVIMLASGCQSSTGTDNNANMNAGDNGTGNTGTNTDTSNTNTNTNTNNTGNTNNDSTKMENDAFKVTTPTSNQEVGDSFTVKGQAKVFEAAFSYKLMEGDKVISEGTAKADKGAPDWGDFLFDVSTAGVTGSKATLVLFEASAKDGSPTHELSIPIMIKSAK